LPRPDAAHRPKLVFEPAATVGEGGGRSREVVWANADGQAKGEPSAAQRVQAGRLLGQEARRALRRDQDAGQQPDAAGHGRRPGEGHQQGAVASRPTPTFMAHPQ
jgi:hypothetical protein